MQEKHESDLTPKEKRQMEFQKIKELKGMERINYLWTYYKVVLVIVLAAIFIISVAATMIKGALTENIFSLAVVDADFSMHVDDLTEELNSLFKVGSLQEISVDTSASSVEETGSEIKLSLIMTSVSETDVVVCGETLKDKYESMEAFQSWEEVLGDDYEKYESYMTDGYIDLSKCEKWQEKGYTAYEPAYLCVLAGSEHPDAVKVFVDYYTGL